MALIDLPSIERLVEPETIIDHHWYKLIGQTHAKLSLMIDLRRIQDGHPSIESRDVILILDSLHNQRCETAIQEFSLSVLSWGHIDFDWPPLIES